MLPTLLAVFAHPDDEVFGVGGTLARYSDEGIRTTLVCTTRGEVGEISDPLLATPETLGKVREGELECSAEALGIFELIFMNYRDSGMVGTPPNEDPRAFINADAEEVVKQLVRVIRRLQPQVVVTFEPYGGYGHPDHIAVHKHTVAAFEAAGDPNTYPELGTVWQPDRLFYSVIPGKFFNEMKAQMESVGLDTSQLPNLDAILERFPDDKITTVVDTAKFTDAKWRAAMCHATQWGEENIFRKMPEDVRRKLMSAEYFAQAKPENIAPKSDLFEGLL